MFFFGACQHIANTSNTELLGTMRHASSTSERHAVTISSGQPRWWQGSRRSPGGRPYALEPGDLRPSPTLGIIGGVAEWMRPVRRRRHVAEPYQATQVTLDPRLHGRRTAPDTRRKPPMLRPTRSDFCPQLHTGRHRDNLKATVPTPTPYPGLIPGHQTSGTPALAPSYPPAAHAT